MSYKFYSGFSLKNEEALFEDYLIVNDFTRSGFSFGAMKAFEECLLTTKRVDVLQLFSPAFFQTQNKKFVRMQLMFFKKDAKVYCDNFLKNIAAPSTFDTSAYFSQGSYEELETLLTYVWDEEKLQALKDKGTKIEIYLGSDDKIIESSKAYEFFKKYASIYYIKNSGHILKSDL